MEFAAVQPRNFGAANLLRVPGPGLGTPDSDDDECEVIFGIRPKSSPLPRRRTSTSSEDESEEARQRPPSHGSRRVSFADAKGLRLVLVKEFDSWGVPKLPGYDQRQAEGQDTERYSYYLSFPSPLLTPPEELGSRVREQRIELESIGLLPGTTVLRGLVRVLNISFNKAVFVRTTLDAWASHFDLLAEYIEGSGDGVTDCFSFKLTLVPPFDEQGARVDFCLRYETSVGTFWANNGTRNYVLFCHQRVKEERETLQEECVCRKSCLKAARQHFTTVDTSLLEDNVQSIEKIITGVSKNGGDLNMNSRQVPDSHPATSEEEYHKLMMESSQNASRSKRRRAARLAKVKDLFFQGDHEPEREKESEASPPELPSDGAREGENLVESTLDSLLHSGGSCADVQRYVSPAQSGETSEAEKSECVDSVNLVQLLGTQRPFESMGRSDRGRDNVCIVNNTGEESHSDVSLAESTEAPVTTPSSFTFGAVLAPLYPLVCGQVRSENHSLADQLNPMRERSMTGDSLENCASISADLTGNNEDTSSISRDPLESHDRKSMNTHLNDVPREDGKLRVSVAADTSTNAADIDCQESEHECTGTPNNPQPTTNEDTTSDVNNEVLNACTTRAGLNLQGKAVEGPQALRRQWKNPSKKQIMADAAKAQTEAEEVFSNIQTQFDPTQTLSQPQVLQETTNAMSQPHLSPFVSACENQEMDQQICCDTATSFICTDESNEQGIQPTMTVSTTNIYQGREIEQLEELDPKCLMYAVMFEATDISDVKTSLEEGDIALTVEHEDSVEVSECVKVKRNSCTHPYMLGKEVELAEKPVCMPAEAERSANEDAVTKQDYFRHEVRTEDKNWEMMVEEEEQGALGEEVMTKEVAENGEKEKDELKEEKTITEQQPLEKTVGCEKREHTETEFEGEKHFCVTEKSKIKVETVEESLVSEEQEVEEEQVKKYADHGTDNQHGVWEEIRNKEKENLAKTDRETRGQVEDKAERISVDEEERSVSGAGEGGVEESVVGTAKEEMNEEMARPETRSHASQNKPESDASTSVSSVHEGEVERVIDKENSPENEATCFPIEMHLISEEEGRSNTYSLHLTSGQSKALSESARHGSNSGAAEKGSLIFTDEPERDPMGEEEKEGDSSSSESPSDEEMELYMHRLRAAPSPQTLRSFPRDGGTGKGSHTGKRPSIDRAKLLPSSMPPISEAANEEQLTRISDTPEEMDVENFQAESTPFPAQDNQEDGGVNTAQWTDAFSCRNILKSLSYITMFVVFVVVAYHYDFFACFALYLLSIFWLYCRTDKQPVKNNNGLN